MSIPSKEDIAAFREWMNKVPYLKNDVDDYIIKAFLLGAKNRMEKAKSTFDNFHTVRFKYPELFANIDPKDPVVLMNFSIGYLVIAPTFSKDGCLVLTGAILDPDVSKYNVAAIYRSLHMMLLQILLDPNYPLRFGEKWNGRMRLVFDMKHQRLGHIAAYTPSLLKGVMEYLSSSIPLRMAGMHIINAPPASVKFFNLMKSLLKKKLADRIHIYADSNQLFDDVAKHLLPTDVGGTLGWGHEITTKTKEQMDAFRDTIIAWDRKMTELEKFRPKKQEEVIVGSFRKLEVD